MSLRPLGIVLGLAVMLTASSAMAQGLSQPFDASLYFGGFQFNGPGARAIAMGTAFIALADDASASEWNPAGLNVILKPEISLQVKRTGNDAPLLVPFGTGQYGRNTEDVNSFAYASYAQSRGRFAYSIYRQELTNYVAKGEFFLPAPNNSTFDSTSSIDHDVKVVNYGLSMAFAFADNKFSIGYSARFGKMDVSSKIRQDFFRLGVGRGTTVNDSDNDYSFNAGFLWKPSKKVSIGGVYKSGPVFNLTKVNFGPSGELGRDDFTVPVPDSYGAGIALRPNDQTTIDVDWVQVEYSELNDLLSGKPTGELQEAQDGDEFHAGLEYVFLTKTPVTLRVGYYTEPSDRSIVRLHGDSQRHVTGGIGLVFGSVFQLDMAANLGDDADEYLISSIFRFGK